MSTQPKALFLADVIDNDPRSKAHHDATAAELRRLHASCEDYAQHKERQDQRILKLHAQRDALLEALKAAAEAFEIAANGGGVNFYEYAKESRAAIKMAEEGK